eukprot:TRINITY_DN2382_c0_g1_i3.p1 TRINITY_DN2382_c0_g1~~TRINITY_DN2382_c0_g1_i3.p1  ORF type:complete len:715 (-),score=225.36 TRINITY_DN2382_c0_g1_i3:28-2172(-)
MERFSLSHDPVDVYADVPPAPGRVDDALVSGISPDDVEMGDVASLSPARSPSITAEEFGRRVEERDRASMDLRRHLSSSLDLKALATSSAPEMDSPSQNPDDWRDTLNARIKMGMLLVSEALDHLVGDSGKWVEDNEQFCRQVLATQLGHARRPDELAVHMAKTTIFDAWVKEVESRAAVSDPDSHIAFTRIRQAHQILYGEITAEDVHIEVVARQATDENSYYFEDERADEYLNEQLPVKARLRRWWHRTVFGETPEEINRPMRAQVYAWLSAFFPIFSWLPEYSFAQFKGDLGAGLSSGAVVVPQAMGYAFLAGLPPIMGLYNAFIPGIIYTILGTSKHLAIGPAAIASILCRGALGSHNPQSPEEWVALAGMLTTLVGINFFIMYLLNLGFLINFLSRPVLSGFATAAAVIIMTSQLGYIFGISVPSEQYAWKGIYNIADRIHESNPYTLVIAAIELIILFSIKKFMPKIPRTSIPFPTPLILVVIGLIVSYNVDLEHHYDIHIVGEIPPGIPAPQFHFSLDKMLILYKDAWVIPLVGLLEAISVAKVCAQKNKYELNMRQEYLALGWANFVGSMFGSYVVLASFGRTALHLNSGGKTHMTNFISVLMVGLCLLFLTEVFKYLPKVSDTHLPKVSDAHIRSSLLGHGNDLSDVRLFQYPTSLLVGVSLYFGHRRGHYPNTCMASGADPRRFRCIEAYSTLNTHVIGVLTSV